MTHAKLIAGLNEFNPKLIHKEHLRADNVVYLRVYFNDDTVLHIDKDYGIDSDPEGNCYIHFCKRDGEYIFGFTDEFSNAVSRLLKKLAKRFAKK